MPQLYNYCNPSAAQKCHHCPNNTLLMLPCWLLHVVYCADYRKTLTLYHYSAINIVIWASIAFYTSKLQQYWFDQDLFVLIHYGIIMVLCKLLSVPLLLNSLSFVWCPAARSCAMLSHNLMSTTMSARAIHVLHVHLNSLTNNESWITTEWPFYCTVELSCCEYSLGKWLQFLPLELQ